MKQPFIQIDVATSLRCVKECGDAAACLLLYYVHRADTERKTWVGPAAVAADLGWSLSKVNKVKATLKSKGFISVAKRTNDNGSSKTSMLSVSGCVGSDTPVYPIVQRGCVRSDIGGVSDLTHNKEPENNNQRTIRSEGSGESARVNPRKVDGVQLGDRLLWIRFRTKPRPAVLDALKAAGFEYDAGEWSALPTDDRRELLEEIHPEGEAVVDEGPAQGWSSSPPSQTKREKAQYRPIPGALPIAVEAWEAIRQELRDQLGDDLFESHFEDFAVSEGDEAHQTMKVLTSDEMAALVVEKNYRDLVERIAAPWSVIIEYREELANVVAFSGAS